MVAKKKAKKVAKRKPAKKAPKKTKRKAVKKAPVKKKATKKPTFKLKVKKPSRELAVIAFLINFFFIFWLGTLILERPEWKKQLYIWIAGLVLTFTIIGAIVGIPLLIAGWIWGMISGIRAIQESK